MIKDEIIDLEKSCKKGSLFRWGIDQICQNTKQFFTQHIIIKNQPTQKRDLVDIKEFIKKQQQAISPESLHSHQQNFNIPQHYQPIVFKSHDQNINVGICHLNREYKQYLEFYYLKTELDQELDKVYQCLKKYNYFIVGNPNFKKLLERYLTDLSSQINCITQFNFIEKVYNLKTLTDQYCQNINKELETIYNGNQMVRQVLKLENLETCKLKFDFDCSKLQNFEMWDIIPLQNIFEIVNYLLQQLQDFDENENEIILGLFQKPLQIKEEIQGVFLLGNTRVGKSTLAQLIINPNLIKVGNVDEQITKEQKENKDVDNVDDNNENEIEEDVNIYCNAQDQNEIVFKINHEMFSSENRQIVSEKLNEKYMIFDCPGFDDTKKIYQLINAFNIYQQLEYCKKPILLILIDGESQHNFYQNFKDTVKQLNAFGDRFLCQNKLNPIFIITKIKYQEISDKKSYLYKINKKRESFLLQKQNLNYIEEFKVFFSAFETGRVIYFPSASKSLNFTQIQQKIYQQIENITKEQQNNIMITFEEIKEIYNYKGLQQYIQMKINFFAQLYFQNMKNAIQKESKESKIKIISEILEILQQSNQSSFIELFKNLEEWRSSKILIQNELASNSFLYAQISNYGKVQVIFRIQISESIEEIKGDLSGYLDKCNQKPNILMEKLNNVHDYITNF